jgi:hypothetical protein
MDLVERRAGYGRDRHIGRRRVEDAGDKRRRSVKGRNRINEASRYEIEILPEDRSA